MTTAREALSRLRALADPVRAAHAQRYFKTGPGEYAEGDRFLGVTVPNTRRVLRESTIDLETAVTLLESEWHEARLLAVLAMVRLYQKGTPEARRKVFDAYLLHTRTIDNWDLVDSSASQIVGPELCGKGGKALAKLARSKLVWERRIAAIATFHALRSGDPSDSLAIAELLVDDDHDLIHKAVGWMLRELDQRCGRDHLRDFLRVHSKTMPRTMLRYAIEHLPPAERKRWMERAPITPGASSPRGPSRARRRRARPVS